MCLRTKKGPPAALAIGNFDGVHLGHQAILTTLAAAAKKNKLLSIVVLFEPHPKEFFLKAVAPRRLQNLRDKVSLIKSFGIDQVVCLRFSQKMANLTPSEFIKNILQKQLNAKVLVLGEDFRFGKNRSGDIDTLKNAGFEIIKIPTTRYQGEKISSTWVREAVLMNDFNLAEQLMQHPYIISGHVVHGNKHGRLLGYPTINIILKANIALHGIYAVRVKLHDKIYEGVANIGRRPALNPIPHPLLEVYIFDYNQECYGVLAEVIFVTKIREEQMFESIKALTTQISEDVKLAQKLLNRMPQKN